MVNSAARKMSLAGFGVVIALSVIAVLCFSGCSRSVVVQQPGLPAALSEVPAVRLNYRYEADVPPTEAAPAPVPTQLNPLVESDFARNRPGDILDKTLASPNNSRVLAVYHQEEDLPAEFRLDMYSSDGLLLQKITADNMAVHFPDTIVWSPDSSSLAFVAMIRAAQGEKPERPVDANVSPVRPSPPASNAADAKVPGADPANASANEASEPAADASPETAPAAPTPTPPVGVLAFRTEQLYLCDSDGGSLKPVTQNEGLIYFYYAWAPDSSALVALAATVREWQYLDFQASRKGEQYIPVGRPRVVERNGRERRLDDGLTAVRPVWSPDSSKIAAAYNTQVRIYDADGSPPSQAAVPLNNSLLLSSQAYDRLQQAQLDPSNTAQDANLSQGSATMLPDPATLVSFNPIVALEWPEDRILYFQTAFIKRMLKEADNVTSFQRWHRLIFSPQQAAN